jgi:hypothetical protein
MLHNTPDSDILPVLSNDALSLPPPEAQRDSEPETTSTEIKAWLSVDFANSVYYAVGISGCVMLQFIQCTCDKCT